MRSFFNLGRPSSPKSNRLSKINVQVSGASCPEPPGWSLLFFLDPDLNPPPQGPPGINGSLWGGHRPMGIGELGETPFYGTAGPVGLFSGVSTHIPNLTILSSLSSYSPSSPLGAPSLCQWDPHPNLYIIQYPLAWPIEKTSGFQRLPLVLWVPACWPAVPLPFPVVSLSPGSLTSVCLLPWKSEPTCQLSAPSLHAGKSLHVNLACMRP